MQSAKYLEVVMPEDAAGLDELKLSTTHRRGVVLFAEGQPAAGVHVLSAGRVKLSITSAEGKTVIIRIARTGDLLGVHSVLKGLPYESTAETLESCRTGFVSRADFLCLIDRSKAAGLRVSRSLCNELSELVDRSRLLLLSQSAQEKLVRLLLKWHDELGKPTPEGTRLSHGLTHEEIGQLICASRETVSRLLTELKRRQIVLLNGPEILVRNRTALDLILSDL